MAGASVKAGRRKGGGSGGAGIGAAIKFRNPFPLILLLLLSLMLAYGLFHSGLPFQPAPPGGEGGGAQSPGVCNEGQARSCTVGNCTGVSTCTGGAWTGCRWERVCTPGAIATCIRAGCAYAVRACNECGTGYGPCAGLSASAS